VHLAIIVIQRHSQFRGPGRKESNVVGTPMWPGYALRSLGLFAAVAAVLVLMAGLIQINPIWLWGPYHPYVGTNGAQPDWYLGWLIGALRLMPNLEIHVFGHTIVPNPFFGGVLFPTIVFALLYALPWLDRRFISKDYQRHDLLDRPRDNPFRSALAASVLAGVTVVFAAGSVDRLFFQFGFGYEGAVWFFRGAFFIVPAIVFWLTRRTCIELKRAEAHPLRGWDGELVVRNARGGFDEPAAAQPSGDSPSREQSSATDS
jgi:ubiquinol-cytochrome c reductase cytochrome b subunit